MLNSKHIMEISMLHMLKKVEIATLPEAFSTRGLTRATVRGDKEHCNYSCMRQTTSRIF